MSAHEWFELAVAVIALAVMTGAATLEALTGSLSRHHLRQLAEERGRYRRTVQALLDPRRSIAAGLIAAQAAALVTAASALTVVLDDRALGGQLLAVVAVTLAFLVFGRALPRTLASRRDDRPQPTAIRPAGWLAALMRPLTLIVDAAAALFARVLPASADAAPPAGTEEELRTITAESLDDGVIEAEERQMIDGVLQLEEQTVREIMVPRIDIVAVEQSAPAREVIEAIVGAGHSRIPVYQESIDQVVGILYAKDLLPFVLEATDQLPLPKLLRPAYVVPESKRIDDLLKELRRSRVHIAIVVDEYGGTAGLVTIEDILEEIVGEIQDEYDTEVPLFEVLGPTEVIADGRVGLEEVAEALRVTPSEDEDYETLNGFVQKHLGRLPRAGDRFEAEGIAVEVLSVERHRVRQVRLTRLAPAADRLEAAESSAAEPPASAPLPAEIDGQ